MAFTAGIAPISDPRYALVILINDPKAGQYYGGAVSAPVFSSIMGYTLRANGIAPDAEPTEKTARRTVRLSDQKLEKMKNLKKMNNLKNRLKWLKKKQIMIGF